MRNFIFLTLILFGLFIGGYFNSKLYRSEEWMNKEFTNVIKGISILLIIWAHVGAKLGIGGIQFIAGIGVCLFLICSGYGLEKSFESNGLKFFWKKRITNVFIPFWIVEFIGLLLTNKYQVDIYIKDIFFIQAATSYGWFMKYILICYIIFYFIKKISKRFDFNFFIENLVYFIIFALWFVLESRYFANPNMIFLKARQMLAFPTGIILCKYNEKIKLYLSTFRCKMIIVGCTFIGILFMIITQIQYIKTLDNILYNIMSLLTVFPLAIAVLTMGRIYYKLFNNKFLSYCGIISFEIYLIHSYTIDIIIKSNIRIVVFIVLTLTLAKIFNFISGGIRNGGFNGYYSYKK